MQNLFIKKEVLMSKKRFLVVLVVVLVFSIFVHQKIDAAQSSFEKLLTVADVERVAGLKGVKLLPKCPGALGSELCLAQQDGTLAVDVSITQGERAPAVWKAWKEGPMSIKNQGGKVTKVTGVGDEAFAGESVVVISFYFRKGKSAVSISSGMVMKKMTKGYEIVPLLSSEQLREMAKIIASRL